ncbi:XRE family transcriptional regulator [Lactonifactor longoviformis]|nr:helix-turn-helix transcriptional regulator [Lactonifactor longoviformis]POP31727.1 XRE family transcriptional regulator [Lactonifactor longoviformis]
MDILGKISQLREERHWSEYQLSVQSGLPQSTISSWYRKDILPSVSSLEKICSAFGITLSQFFWDGCESVILSPMQKELLRHWNRLNKEQQISLLNLLSTFT